MNSQRPPQITLIRSLLFVCAVSGALLMSLIALTACGSGAASVQDDPLAVYRPALKPEFQHDLDDLGPVPRYTIDAIVDTESSVLTGTAKIAVPNTTQDPWTDLVFRLYPMLDHYGGRMVLQSVLVNGKPATFLYVDDRTAVRVDLTKPLLPGQEATVDVGWRLEAPVWDDLSSVYALFGRSQEMLSLPLFYPSLSVYQPGPALGSGRWWLENGTIRGDSAFNVAALFAVTLTLPAEWVPVTSGTLVSSTMLDDGLAQHHYVTGPSREFLLHASPLFRQVSGETYGTRVTSYYLPGSEAVARAALKYAQQSLAIYSDRFGEYPFTDMRVSPAPISFRGMEYPQTILLGVELYTRYRQNLELLVAHEMAHQWWYNIVQNDPVTEPWLDEALAEYSMKIYMENMRGEDDAEGLLARRWQAPLDGLANKGEDTAVNQPVNDFLNGTQYETVVYAKGALFYDKVRDAVGSRRFNRFLHRYLDKHRWQIVDTSTWLGELQDLPEPSLSKLFEEMIDLPTPQAQAFGTGVRITPTPSAQ